MLYVELFIQGLIQGSIYALIAVGLTLVYGMLRVLHVAHAGLFTLGGYLGIIVTNATGSLLLGLIVAMGVVGVIGVAIYRFAYHPILKHPPFVALIASIGLYIAMEEIFRIIFGPYGATYDVQPLQGHVAVLGMRIKIAELVTFVGAIVTLAVLGYLSNSTRTGIAWRATVTAPKMAEAFGIDILKVRYLNFFIGSALAAAAGVMVALLNNLVEPTSGAVPSYKALAIIVLGGLGSLRGTLVACFALGVIEAYGTIYLGWLMDRDAIAFLFLILVLMIRPHGLFARA
jgi:branched-chain amino acid transport system permease protein